MTAQNLEMVSGDAVVFEITLVDSSTDGAVNLAGCTASFVMGARTELPPDLAAALQEVRSLVKCPVAVGFGISTPEQVKWLAPYVDGVVVGSAIVDRVARALGR